MNAIQINNISFSYSEREILKGISTAIPKGKITALIGPNGSGKSTLLKCINRINPITKGEILLEGEPIQKVSLSNIAKKIAFVPQQNAELSEMRVFDILLSGRLPYMGWRTSEKDFDIVASVLNQLSIDTLAMAMFAELSGGQKQMILIARALIQQTDIIILDEPTNNLDIAHQLDIMRQLQTLVANGKTIIVTLHDINLAYQFCEYFILLKKGHIIAQGNKEVIEPQNLENLYDVKMKKIQANNEVFFVSEMKM